MGFDLIQPAGWAEGASRHTESPFARSSGTRAIPFRRRCSRRICFPIRAIARYTLLTPGAENPWVNLYENCL